MDARRAALLHAFALVAALALVLRVHAPRVPEDEPGPREFSVENARADLERIARAPHPVGSDEHGAVRAYLERRLAEVAALFGEVDGRRASVVVQEGAWSADRFADLGGSIPVANLMLHVPGTTLAPALLLAAHYDSRHGAPGAGDDGSACAAWLEVLRALAEDGPPRGDLLLLLTDAEEQGLCGAELFAERYEAQRESGSSDLDEAERVAHDSGTALDGATPDTRPVWAGPLRGVLNFEAIGNDGPSILFQTGPESGAFLDAYRAAAPHPVGSSLAPWIYDQLPNDTDLSVFRRMGLPGLNFAIVGGGGAYHRPHDTPANLPDATLAHQGRTMLALVRELDARAGDTMRAPDLAFGDLAGGAFVTFGPGLGPWLARAAIVAAAVVLLHGARRHWLAQLAGGLWVGVLTLVGTALATLVLVRLGAWLGGAVAPLLGVEPVPRGNATSVAVAYLAALVLAFGAAPLAELLRRTPLAPGAAEDEPPRLLGVAGALLVGAGLARHLAHLAPEGAHTLAVPVVLAACAVALLGRGRVAAWREVAGAVLVLLALVASAPLWLLLVQVLGTHTPSARTVAAVLAALVAVWAGPSLARLPGRPLAAAGLGGGLLLAVAAGLLEASGA